MIFDGYLMILICIMFGDVWLSMSICGFPSFSQEILMNKLARNLVKRERSDTLGHSL